MRPARLLAALAAALLLSPTARAGEPTFKKVDINPKSIFEAGAAMDVDGDGDLDIVSGSTWYEAPGWAPHPVRDFPKVGTYTNAFAVLPLDVDGDGDTDFMNVSYFNKDVAWVENPGPSGGEWPYHKIDEPGPSECAVLVDLTGDGTPEILPNTVNTIVFYAHTGPGKIEKVAIGDTGAAHGVGTGDVNRDGKLDILTPTGWYENPGPDKALDPKAWRWRQQWNLGTAGIQIYADDYDGDGLTDLLWGMGHAVGLYWARQTTGSGGEPVWDANKQLIDDTVSSVHVLEWADLNGDGKANELISGKRVYAHEVEPGDTRASVVAYYRFDTAAKGWKRFPLFEGQPATPPAEAGQRDAQKDFPPGTAGTGLEVDAVDIDKDGDLDIVCPGKSGLYLFVNEGSK